MREQILLNIFSIFTTINALTLIFMTRSIGSILSLFLVVMNICVICLMLGAIYPAIAIFIMFISLLSVILIYSVIIRDKNHNKLEISVSNPKILKIIHYVFISLLIEFVSVVYVLISYPNNKNNDNINMVDFSSNMFQENAPLLIIIGLLIFISISSSIMLLLRIRTEKIVRSDISEQFTKNKEDEIQIVRRGDN